MFLNAGRLYNDCGFSSDTKQFKNAIFLRVPVYILGEKRNYIKAEEAWYNIDQRVWRVPKSSNLFTNHEEDKYGKVKSWLVFVCNDEMT